MLCGTLVLRADSSQMLAVGLSLKIRQGSVSCLYNSRLKRELVCDHVVLWRNHCEKRHFVCQFCHRGRTSSLHHISDLRCELEEEASSVAEGTVVMSIPSLFKSERHASFCPACDQISLRHEKGAVEAARGEC